LRNGPLALLLAFFAVLMTVALTARGQAVGDHGYVPIICYLAGTVLIEAAAKQSEAAIDEQFQALVVGGDDPCFTEPHGFPVTITKEDRNFVDHRGETIQFVEVEVFQGRTPGQSRSFTEPTYSWYRVATK
tara:strand:+ start:1753 stop:2145 length:393 start_codon:yes stop_codon:yes gene_type:complete